MHLKDFVELAQSCRDRGFGFEEFRRQGPVIDLRWPSDVLEQWIYDHAGHTPFLRDYEKVELTGIAWRVEPLPLDEFLAMSTGPSEISAIEYFAADPDHWVAVRKHGEHMGVREAWETHGTWKRWPIVIDGSLLTPPTQSLQLVEGRTRVGVLRGRRRDGKLVADRHLAWVGRPRA